MKNRIMQGLVLGGLGCGGSGPTEADVARAVVAGDVAEARSLAERVGSERWMRTLDDWAALEQERATTRQAERAWTLERINAAMASGDRVAGLQGLAAGLELARALGESPDRFRVQVDDLLAMSDEAPESRLQVFRILLDADPDNARAYREGSRDVGIELRYRSPEGLVKSTVGISRDMLRALLTDVEERYVRQPEFEKMVRSARSRVARVAATASAREQFAGLAELALPPEGAVTSLEDAARGAADLTTALEAAGVPSAAAVSEVMLGLVEGLDPYSTLILPSEVASWENFNRGVEVGIGATVRVEDQGVFIRSLEPGGPAWTSGVHLGDRLVEVTNGGDTVREEGVVAALDGPPDSRIGLAVERDGRQVELEVTRGFSVVETVRGLSRDPDNGWNYQAGSSNAYVRIESFRESTDPQLLAAVSGIPDLQGVLLDLRGNPGGDVNAAAWVVDRFVKDGIVARLAGRGAPVPVNPEGLSDEDVVPWNQALPGDVLEGVPTVVLVDRSTASSAELVAGALRMLAGARIVGARTTGKGLSQTLHVNDLGFALQLTNAFWELPDGSVLHARSNTKGGIVPDVIVGTTPVEELQVLLTTDLASAIRTHADATEAVYVPPLVIEDVPTTGRDAVLERGWLELEALKVLKRAEASSTGS